MKKITKKTIKSLPQYMVVIDWMSDYRTGFSYELIPAENILDAMDIAEEMFDRNTVYLIKLCERTEEVYENEHVIYKDVLTNRGHGWHRSDEKHCEQTMTTVFHPEYNVFGMI